MADYPGEVYDPREINNADGVEYDEEQDTIIFAEDVDKLNDEVVAVETELGTDPAGDYDDVKTRLENNEKAEIVFIIDGGGSEIATGQHGHVEIPFKCEIVKATLLADQTGSIKIDIWKDSYANFPPDNTDSICGGNEPEISSGVKDQDATLTDWTKAIAAGDILAFNVDSVTDIERVSVILQIKKVA